MEENENNDPSNVAKMKAAQKHTGHGFQKAMLLTRKILWHVQIIGIAIATVEVFLEGEKHDVLINTMDTKVGGVKKQLNKQIFELRITELKSKFQMIKSTFDLVMHGEDDSSLRKSRLDALFVVCEEVFLIVSEPQSELYKAAHRCIDLVT